MEYLDVPNRITILSDPLANDYGPSRPAVLLAREFTKWFEVSVVSTYISEDVMRNLESSGVRGISLGSLSRLKDSSLAFLKYWLKEVNLGLNSQKLNLEDGLVLNFSNTIIAPCTAWYAQGAVSVVLRNIRDGLTWYFRYALLASGPFLDVLDRKAIRRMQALCQRVVANSKYSSNCYAALGVKVDKIIYEPLDCEAFQPSCHNPSEDYVLTYLGKETDFRVLRGVADAGVKIKAFGSKLSRVPGSISSHPNIEVSGWLDHNGLVDAYSNALFTFFPFTDEEFGYVPAESMSCGTPVLTYGKQGPAETVINDVTGWLTSNSAEMINMARQLWYKREVSEKMRRRCRDRALEFASVNIARQWFQTISTSNQILRSTPARLLGAT